MHLTKLLYRTGIVPMLVLMAQSLLIGPSLLGQTVNEAWVKEATARKALDDYEWFAGSEEEKAITILRGDVYSFFNMESKTPLQRKLFERTEEFRSLQDSLNSIRDSLTQEWHYVTLSLAEEYDIHTGYFTVNEWTNCKSSPRRAVGRVGLPQLSYVLDASLAESDCPVSGGIAERTVFYCDEKTANEIENRHNDIRVLVLFKMAGTYHKSYRWRLADGWYDVERDMISTKNVRLVVVSQDGSRIFYWKSFADK